MWLYCILKGKIMSHTRKLLSKVFEPNTREDNMQSLFFTGFNINNNIKNDNNKKIDTLINEIDLMLND